MIDQPSLQSKADAFAQDPDRFIDTQSIVFAIARTPSGYACLNNPKNSDEARRVMVFSNMELTKQIILIEAKAQESKIVPASGGILSAARRGLFRGKK